MKGTRRQRKTQEQNKKEWARSEGLCQKHKPQHLHHVKESPRGRLGQIQRVFGTDPKCLGQIQRVFGVDPKCLGQIQRVFGPDPKCLRQIRSVWDRSKKCLRQIQRVFGTDPESVWDRSDVFGTNPECLEIQSPGEITIPALWLL